MNEEQKFWVSVWSLLAIVVVVAIAAITSYNIQHEALLAASPKPLELACATNGNSQLNSACVTLQLRKEAAQ